MGALRPLLVTFRLVGLKCIKWCNEIKVLEVKITCEGLTNSIYLNVHHIIVESDYSEAINLLFSNSIDITKVSFFIDETKAYA